MVALNQQDVPGTKTDIGQALFQAMALPGNRHHVQTVPLPQVQPVGGAAHQLRRRRDNGLGQANVTGSNLRFRGLAGRSRLARVFPGLFLRIVAFLFPDHIGEGEPGEIHKLLQAFRIRLNQQQIPFPQHAVGGRCRRGLVTPDQGQHHHTLVALSGCQQVVQGTTGIVGTLRHPQFGHVVPHTEQLVAGSRIVPLRRQAPAYQPDKQDTGHSDGQAHRGEIHQAERTCLPVAGNDDVRRCTDQGDGATQQ